MIRILLFLIVVFALGLGFAWLADRPGDMVVTLSGYQYQVSLMVAAVAVTAVVAAVMILWWLVKAIWNSPYTISRYFRVRRRDRGYQALSSGMIAAGAGDGTLARKMNKQAAKLINAQTEPLIQLLDAQASLLEGDHETARSKFEAMLDDPEMRLLGLRGLYLEAERLGDRAAARHYAGRAAEAAPHLAWAANATIEERDRAGRLGRRAETGRKPEGDAADRTRGGKPAPRDTADGEGESAVRHRSGRLPQCSARGQQAVARLCAGCCCCCQGAVQAQRPAQGRKDPRGGMAGGRASGCWRSLRSCAARRCRQRSAGAGPQAEVDEAEQRRIGAAGGALRRSRRAITRRRAKRPNRRRACSRARARSCCSPTSRRPRAAIRAASGSICRRRCVRRVIRPGSPTASCRTMGAGVAGYRPHRCVRVARSGRAARPTDRAGCRCTEPASRDRADTARGAAKDADEVADILDVADLAPESTPGRPGTRNNLAGF